MLLKEHEKFWAFSLLGFGVLVLVLVAVTLGNDAKDPVIRIVDAACGGFLLALGSAANALFRVNSSPSIEVPTNPRTNQPTMQPVPPVDEPEKADAEAPAWTR
jgi:hypothetical protein